ncbi:FkbM family methyltransferase [Ferruginibacter sp. HRS2-29]|uniref:FkbM family methyltransferase n=1 Tax=Ferruginibacter sp. HRS2-29 TaxID=2487334 RepID=UPI0020CBD89B|nr:FkbM family methyltransferase [Ferruginibacter sp. HRS2-29]MCP9751946.1 FkbM family methyltransferase [Ferruginibacter sp. HRS2-29]
MGNKKFTLERLGSYLEIKFNMVVRSINRKTGKILAGSHDRNVKRAEKEWDDRFQGRSYFEHTINNSIRINLYKDSILSKVIVDGFEENEIVFMQKFLKPGDTFLDIGSNIGLFSLLASGIVGANGKIIAFEPSPLTYSRLMENITLNNFTNITARNIGLSDKPGTLEMQQSDNGYDAWNTFAPADSGKFHKSISVPVATLDDELAGVEKEKVALIKLDVEGWEKYVLEGGLQFLRDHSPTLIIEFTDSNTFAAGYFVQDIFTLLESLGYQWFTYENDQLAVEKMRLHYPYNNLIATKNEANVRQRIGIA